MTILSEMYRGICDAEAAGFQVIKIELGSEPLLAAIHLTRYASSAAWVTGMIYSVPFVPNSRLKGFFLHCTPKPKPPQPHFFWLGIAA